MLNSSRQKFNKTLGRQELNYSIFCYNCKKHICDSDFEMDPKLCIRCSGEYERILNRFGVPQKDIVKLNNNL